MQKRVQAFMAQNGLSTCPQARFIDLSSELGELGKALLASGDYGTRPITATEGVWEEAGDCLFALLALCGALDVDASGALEAAICKYSRRLAATGTAASDRAGGPSL